MAAPGNTPTSTRAGGRLAVVSGISLANKSQVLFGVAAAGVLTCALAVPWIHQSVTVRSLQTASLRQIAAAWLDGRTSIPEESIVTRLPGPSGSMSGTRVYIIPELGPVANSSPDDDIDKAEIDKAEEEAEDASPGSVPDAAPATNVAVVPDVDSDADPFLTEAWATFRTTPDIKEFRERISREGRPMVRFARPLRIEDLKDLQTFPATLVGKKTERSNFPPGRIVALLAIERDASRAESLLLRGRIFILTAGTAGILLTIIVFYFILKKLIFSPVRKLRTTVERVQAGDLSTRSDLSTGDEFEGLSQAFNEMLDRLERGRDQLEQMNRNLDLKVDELAEVNVGLDEANRLKSEFVASVSHELRTPLNSIIGFAELLQELATSSDDASDPASDKRQRYLGNIVSSGRDLLEMINDLLDMAKIESGRMEVDVEPTSIADVIEGLTRIMAPQAESRSITLGLDVASSLPMVDTDAGKLQQILYNFLSNAIKFSPEGGTVLIGAERVTGRRVGQRVRIRVQDSGPGIPADMQDVIFEKFRQIDGTHTRTFSGTGLGLAICRSLAEMLGAEVSCTSEPGHGATFYVEIPVVYRAEEPKPLMGP